MKFFITKQVLSQSMGILVQSITFA